MSAYFFDPASADRAVDFVERYCRHTKGEWAGDPLILEDWQKDEIVRPLFGWKRKCCPTCASRRCAKTPFHPRRYRVVYVEIPRKNGKSTLAAAIAWILFIGDHEPGSEVYSAANDRGQASIVFNYAAVMADFSPQLAKRVKRFTKSMTNGSNNTYQVLSADVDNKHGFNAHGVIFDELHTQPNRKLYDVLMTSTTARRQPVKFLITTAGHDRNSVCWEVHERALKIQSGEFDDDTFLPVIYAADKDDDWTDPKTWAKANPNFGLSPTHDALEELCREAQQIPAFENTFRRLHLNQWTQQSERWLSVKKWDKCDHELHEDLR